MTGIAIGRYAWGARRDEDGHRTYFLTSLVETTNVHDGPFQAMNASGLPTIGSAWSVGNDYDPWAYCLPSLETAPHVIEEGEPNRWWLVKQEFTTRPYKRCQDVQIENPLAEPAKISGSFVKKTKLITEDRNGDPILSSSHELTLGVEKDVSTPSVVIEYNVASLDLDDLCSIIDTVNDAVLWGFPKRCVKLSNVVWGRNVYGVCNFYYTRRFEFDVDEETHDDSDILDRGFRHFDTKRYPVGTGHAYRSDPTKFVVNRDANGDPYTEPENLNGYGDVIEDVTAPFAYVPTVEKYDETNFLLYGIPSVLE